MKQMYNTKLTITNLDEAKYDMLIDFLEDNHINYNETDYEEFMIDTRSEEEQYQDWLSEQADLHNDQVKMGLE